MGTFYSHYERQRANTTPSLHVFSTQAGCRFEMMLRWLIQWSVRAT